MKAASFKKKTSTQFFLRKLVYTTKLFLKKFGFRDLNETLEADSVVLIMTQIQRSFLILQKPSQK
jgi:hypothetical protein